MVEVIIWPHLGTKPQTGVRECEGVPSVAFVWEGCYRKRGSNRQVTTQPRPSPSPASPKTALIALSALIDPARSLHSPLPSCLGCV